MKLFYSQGVTRVTKRKSNKKNNFLLQVFNVLYVYLSDC